LISAAAIIVGFGVTAIMFRVQREIYVREELKINLLWLAWADYLLLSSVGLAVFGVLLPILAVGRYSVTVSVAAAVCAAAIVLLAGYIPAILAHYRIGLGATRQGPREKGEPLERRSVCLTAVAASVTFGITLGLRLVQI
jgi:hypothetical protein